MSSKHAVEKSEKYSASRRNLDIDDKLTSLSCPFTWGMNNIIENRREIFDVNKNQIERVVDLQDHFPEFVLIYHVILAYENVISSDLLAAEQSVNNAEKTLAVIKQKATLKNVENVLQHIFVATKCHVLQKLDRESEVEEILYKVCDVDDMNNVELAMLNGCQCLGWSLYSTTDNLKAINHAKKAIEYDSSNGKWHFLLGKNCRKLRRAYHFLYQMPNRQEISAFEEAFRLSENVLFGVSLAQLYRETLKYKVANQIYRKVYDLQPTCCKVRLQLALGFIRAKQCELAKECLDYVAENMPNSTIYTHYMAIYQEKCKYDLKAALLYYKESTENSNYPAEWQYIRCRRKVERSWDPLPYMLGLFEKYKNAPDHLMEEINVQVGTYYLFEMNDVLSACRYLTKAIEVLSNAMVLKKHFLLFVKSDNVYHTLIEKLQSALQDDAGTYGDEDIAVLQDTLQLCHKNYGYLSPSSISYQKRTQGFQLSKNYRNYDSCLSSCANISVREGKPGSSSLGFPKEYPQRNSGDVKNLRKEYPRSFREKDAESVMSNVQLTRGDRSKQQWSRKFQDKEDSTFTHCVRNTKIKPPASSKSRNENDGSEAEASCILKSLKDLNI